MSHDADALGRLTAALAPRYRVERELGRGGMATVYLAEDLKHHRQVAIKVLHPELAASLGVERFNREIEIAGKLSHPNILSLHDSGEADGQLFYVMPYVEGESLRQLLNRERQLSFDQALQITCEVADALSHAHAHGVIHRDIKPENIMFQEGHAVVSDFGIARAVTEAGGEKLTQTGVAVGTPTYMSPEQAAGVGTIDARSDVYAVGCLLYEMMAGEPPFTGPTPHAIMARHAMDPVPSLRTVRGNITPGVEAAITKALAKVPADRFRTATEFAEALQQGSAPAIPSLPAHARASLPIAAVGFYLVSAALVLGLVYALVRQLGLPDWVFSAAIALLAVGLPIVTFTGYLERRRELAQAAGGRQTRANLGLRKTFTWRRALTGGVVAFGSLAVVAGVYMGMRLLGIGPVGTLLAAGVLEERDAVILSEFTDRTGDSTLALAVTEAFRVDLAQSPAVRLVRTDDVREALKLMERDPAMALDVELAREVAVRFGIKAVVGGEINEVGGSYVLSVRLVSPEDGEHLAAFRETAADEAGLIPAIDRLSKKLRRRIGESLRALRGSQNLNVVVTPSLAALRKYTEAWRARELENDIPKAVTLLEQATAIDTGFVSAYRLLSTIEGNRGNRVRQVELQRKVFAHRDRLPNRDRPWVLAGYYWQVEGDLQKALTEYRADLELSQDSGGATNLALVYATLGQFDEAETLFVWMIDHDRVFFGDYANLVVIRLDQGKLAEAEETIAAFVERFPGSPQIETARVRVAVSRGDYDRAEAHLRALREEQGTRPRWRGTTSRRLGDLAQLRGRLGEAERAFRAAMAAEDERGNPTLFLTDATYLASIDALWRDRPARALETMRAALEQHPLSGIFPEGRPYLELAVFYADAGRPDLAQPTVAEYEREVDPGLRGPDAAFNRHRALASIALAEARWKDAIEQYRLMEAAPRLGRRVGAIAGLGRAYDQAGEADSAIASYERYLSTPSSYDPPYDARSRWLARIHRRLGELYETRGLHDEAIEHYNRFVDLWKDADPELQTQVDEVKGHLARLVREPR